MSSATRDGRPWQPQFLLAIDAGACIGCGRCYKVCGRNVMTLRGLDGNGELVEDLDDDEEVVKKVMAMDDAGACIGCGACARVCPTNCQSHGTAPK